MSFDDPIVGGTVLRTPAIQSPNFSLGPPLVGWAIYQNGQAYFGDVTASGSITATVFDGTNFTIDSSGIFFYSGTPAAGNLLLSIANAAGTDTYGNTYPEGSSFTAAGKSVVTGITGGSPLIYFISGLADITNGAALQDIVQGVGNGAYEFLQILSAEDTTQNDLVLTGYAASSKDGTTRANITHQYKDSSGVFHILFQASSTGISIPVALGIENTATFTEAASSTVALQSLVTGDPDARFVLTTAGAMAWGPGSAATDVTLARTAAALLTLTGSLTISGALTATGGTAAAPTLITTDTWHNVTPGTGWSLGVSPNAKCSYRLRPDGEVEISGDLMFAGTPAGGSLMFTLPVGYRPTSTHAIMGYDVGHSVAFGVIVNTNGNVNTFATAAGANPAIFFNAQFPLNL